MKNFKNFESAYEALINAHRALNEIPYWCINEQGENVFRSKRLDALKGIAEARMRLRQWLKENFPRDRADAYHSDGFSFPEFFAMLKKYPELAEENKDALEALLHSLKAGDLTPTRLEQIPDISEFV